MSLAVFGRGPDGVLRSRVSWSAYNLFRRFKMPESQVPDVSIPSSPPDEASRDDFEKTL